MGEKMVPGMKHSIMFIEDLLNMLPRSTAVSAGHQSKSCSVYEKCEDIFFPKIIFIELNMFYKNSSETVKALRKCNRIVPIMGCLLQKTDFLHFFLKTDLFQDFFFKEGNSLELHLFFIIPAEVQVIVSIKYSWARLIRLC